QRRKEPVMSVMSIFKKKSFYVILILILAVVGYSTYVKIMNDRYEAQQQDDSATPVDDELKEDLDRDNTYSVYLKKHKDASRPNTEIVVDLFDYAAADKVVEYDVYEGKDKVLVSEEGGFVEWTV